eukprot:TRINITY_DN115911_c0_g1_i1.p1 TRINITY_DN115911_c0_g1~~TRINITY_DN115911_c0_g1_i1.p1  ORF type:complete len:465 (+),score=144.78 TRINITY_DN115911_c0_g1_i1:85-1395(+)
MRPNTLISLVALVVARALRVDDEEAVQDESLQRRQAPSAEVSPADAEGEGTRPVDKVAEDLENEAQDELASLQTKVDTGLGSGLGQVNFDGERKLAEMRQRASDVLLDNQKKTYEYSQVQKRAAEEARQVVANAAKIIKVNEDKLKRKTEDKALTAVRDLEKQASNQVRGMQENWNAYELRAKQNLEDARFAAQKHKAALYHEQEMKVARIEAKASNDVAKQKYCAQDTISKLEDKVHHAIHEIRKKADEKIDVSNEKAKTARYFAKTEAKEALGAATEAAAYIDASRRTEAKILMRSKRDTELARRMAAAKLKQTQEAVKGDAKFARQRSKQIRETAARDVKETIDLAARRIDYSQDKTNDELKEAEVEHKKQNEFIKKRADEVAGEEAKKGSRQIITAARDSFKLGHKDDHGADEKTRRSAMRRIQVKVGEHLA